NGLGMDGATLARVFEPFFTTKAFGKGSGLGMAMVYGFVKQSGGSVRVSSTPGQGTSVTLLLPAMREDGEVDDAPDLPLANGGNGERLVLLVEDDPDVRKIVRLQLTDLGYPVIEAENGPEAVSMINNVPDIALILSDIVMPGGIDGWELARFAKENHPQVRIVLMSGYAYGGSEEDIKDPELPMLSKPFEKSQLSAILQSTEA
ncbi:MAG TPA: response regulator, partial [Azonexus sp.]|nr:response regulator [Azonexus sp.]